MDQAERLRNIVKAQEISVGSNARLITVTSGKGGVGKSSIAINLAVQFSKLGYRVIIFDADFGLANIEVMFGAIPKYNLSDVIFHGRPIEDIVVKGPMDIKFVSGGSGISELSNLSKDNVRYLSSKLAKLETMADIIIVDTGAGISDTVLEFVKASREVLLVTTPEPTSITDSYALLKALKRSQDYDFEHTSISLVANKVIGKGDSQTLFSKLSVVVEKFLDIKIKFLGFIPNDPNVTKAVMQQKPISMVYEKSQASQAFEKLARDLLSEPAKEGDIRGSIGQIFLNIFRIKSAK